MSQAKIELFLSGGNGTQGGQIDLHGDEPITISMAFNDIRDISALSTSVSQQFLVPGSSNNNQLFTQIFNITSDSTFDARKKTPSFLMVDSIPVLTGNLQLTDIFVDDQQNIQYQILLLGDTSSFVTALSDNYLTDLSFSALNHYYVYSAITDSWTSTTKGYYYPLIDYGYGFNYNDFNGVNGISNVAQVSQFFPATYAKTILDNIFHSTGFTYSSSIFNGPDFARTMIPFNGSLALNESISFCTGRTFIAQLTGNTSILSNYLNTNDNANEPPEFSFSASSAVLNPLGLYSSSTFKFSADTAFNTTFGLKMDFNNDIGNYGPAIDVTSISVNFYRSTYAGGTAYFDQCTVPPAPQANKVQTLLFGTNCDNPLSTRNYPAKPGETFWANVKVVTNYAPGGGGSIGPGHAVFQLSGSSYWFNNVTSELVPGQLVDYDIFIPQKIKQLDFVNSLLTMYNCFVIQDVNNPKNIILETRDVFYASGATKNWTNKLDLSQSIQQSLISELNPRKITLTHKTDQDYYNNNYQTVTNRTYGDYIFEINNDFNKDEQVISTIFSPTPVGLVQGYAASQSTFIIPIIEKLDPSNAAGYTASNIRIVQKSKNNVISLQPYDYWDFNNVIQTTLPYVGMFDDPLNSTSDISFGAPNFLYYTASTVTSNNLEGLYWDKYLSDISDKNSKLITCFLYLTPADIQQFAWNDSIYIEHITDGGGEYFHVNKIDYTCTSNEPSRVELIKISNKYVPKASNSNNISIGIGSAVSAGIKTNSLVLGSNATLAQRSIVVGQGNNIGINSNNSFVIGNQNSIGGGVQGNSIIGGSNNTINGASNVSLIGVSNVTATTSNSLVIPQNLVFANTSGGTIATINVTQLTGSTLWSSSTGAHSVIFVNNTLQNYVGTAYGNILGGKNNKIN